MERPSDEVYGSLITYLQKYLYRMTNDLPLAEDLTQMSIMKGLRVFHKFSGESTGEFFRWHKTIAYYQLLEYRDQQRTKQQQYGNIIPIEGDGLDVPTTNPYSVVDQMLDVKAALGGLLGIQSRALVLDAYGYSATERGQMEGATPMAIHSRTFKGRKLLKEKVNEQEGTQG